MRLLVLLLTIVFAVVCDKWSECDTCMFSVNTFMDFPERGGKMRKRDKLKKVCEFVEIQIGDPKHVKLCNKVLREVIASKSIFRKMQASKLKNHGDMKPFCAEGLSKSYCEIEEDEDEE
ncbi:unnamed protein product [Strongylus vulgaris]|uniref:Saposin B-type domain-containing protein n=1 Tax=Strongylus vulgaris TaxID=40348 RepID=A0A3P7L760_STRVU|nr:unnamed protein product [Strongylus vulgaris]